MLLVASALAASGCASVRVEPPASLPDREVEQLTDLLTFPRLEWLLLLQPEQLATTPWLESPIARLLRDERLDLLAQVTGLDLRVIPEFALAGYIDGTDDCVAWLLRHRDTPLQLERKFRQRLTSDPRRIEVDHQLLRVSGKIGTRAHGFVTIGPDVVGYQFGGDQRQGPMRIASLYAQGRLENIPTVLADPTLGALDRALRAPIKLLLPGPFEGERAGGLRGLLGAASGAGAALAPTDQQTLRLSVLLAGEYGEGDRRQDALPYLQAAWQDLVDADLGRLLRLHEPVTPPQVFSSPLGIGLQVTLDPMKLADGLAAATIYSVRQIMR